MERNNQVIQRGRPVSGLDAAHANEYFEQFVNASTLKHILGYYRGLIDNLHLKPNVFTSFYPKLRANLTSWRAKALWKKFDARAFHKCYGKGKISGNTRVLIIGGGPCGLRSAIEAQLLGAKVVVIEKRDRFSRNNVLHLWPFVIEDLRMLGAKKFFGKFCAGAIDHISIRQLQCILLKVALLLGVEVHTEVSFEKLIEPNATEKTGWRAEFKPSNHPVNHYEFDVIIGADGKRNTLQGFSRKEFRGKLAIAITANFINRKTEAEARVEEISGVAFIFNQKFFKELQEETRIDLENIVYYKDDTHYFVMTAKKASLLEKCVIKQDLADTEKLLAPDNVDKEALQQYAIDAANFSTNYQLPHLEFAVNHYGQPDIAMFDFTSMYAAENASKMVERNGYRLLMILVGDSLLEPFWPTGSGCARGFLSSLDAAWAIRTWSIGNCTPLEVLAERESIYRLLAQTTPDNLNKDWKSYTVDPSTRYPNLNKTVVLPHQVVNLFDTDNPASIEKMKRNSHERTIEAPRKRRRGNVDNEVLLSWLRDQLKEDENIQITDIASVFKGGKILCAIIHHYRPDLLDYNSIQENEPTKNNQLAFDVLEKELGIPPVMTGEEITNTEDYLTMATYLTEVFDTFRGEIPHIKHPKLELPESTKHSDLSFKTVKTSNVQILTTQQSRPSSRHKRHIETAPNKPCSTDNKKTRKRRTLEKIGVSVDHENKAMVSAARGGGTDEDVAARIKSLQKKWSEPQPVDRKPKDLLRAIGKIETSDWNIKEIEKKIMENKMGKPNKTFDKEKVPKWSKEQFLARQTKMEKQHLDRQDSTEAKFADIDKSIKNLDQKLKEGTVRQLGTNKIATLTEKLVSKVPPEPKPPEKTVVRPPVVLPTPTGSEFCHFCRKRVYLMERLSAEGRFFHHGCFKCQYCNTQLRLGSYAFDRDGLYGFKFFCLHHFGMVGEIHPTKVVRKPSQKLTVDIRKSPEKKSLTGITGVDLLDRVQTPERIEFSNLSSGHISSDHEDPLSQMDEDEWTDKNFGASCAEMVDSDEESSSLSDTDSDDEDAFDDALEEPVTKEGTMKWAERWKNSYSKKRHTLDSDGYSSSDQSSYYDSSDDDESDTATEGEEEIRARELRKQEVRVEPPVVQTDTGTDTEIVSDESSTESSSEVRNSATEISTDSEFAQDDPTPTRELPIILSDFNVTKTRGSGRNYPKKIQVTTGYLQKPIKEKTKRSNPHIELKLKPLVPLAPIKKPAPLLLPRTEGYSLNRTQSTGGIAAKVSLELKKKYLLGEPTPGNIQKSGSASTLDTKFKTFQTNISDCQKLLKPAPEISASMQTFVTKLDERKSPILSPQSSVIFGKEFTKVEESSQKNPSLFTDLTIITKVTVNEEEQPAVSEKAFENESEGRPRSPVHETSIIVPQIDWSKNHQSLSSDSLASSDSENDVLSKPKPFENIPRVEVHEAKDEEKEDNLHDSLTDPHIENKSVQIDNTSVNSHSEAPKSISSEKKTLNQPKTLPSLETMLPEIHNSLHIKFNKADNRFSREISEIETKSQKNSSGLSSPDSVAEQITAALTETELSDWARDDAVSDDFEEVAFETSHNVNRTISNVKKAKMAEFDDIENISGSKHNVIDLNNKTILTEAMNNVLSSNLDNIEFMDTGTETSSDDGIPDSQSGYILFKNEDEFAEDSLNPNINEIFEAKNIHLNEKGIKNTGYCIIINEDNTTEDKTTDMEKTAKNLSVNNEQEEDSLLVLETAGTTTEENTFSDSTVKNLTEISVDKQETPVKLIENNNSIKQRLEEKLATIKAEAKLKEKETIQQHEDNIEFDEHCKRLQSKVEFSNAKDSIDIRKSRRKSKSDSPQKPDLIQEEKIENKDITLTLSPTPHTPDILYNKDVIKKERDVNQKLIQEMVMNKMKAENKSLERKKRIRSGVSPSSPFALSKSATTDIVSQINLNNLDKNNRKSTYSTSSSNYSTPDVLLSSNIIPLQNSVSVSAVPNETSFSSSSRPLSIHPTFSDDTPEKDVKTTAAEETQSFSNDNAQFTPKAPPRQHRLNNDDVNKKLEKLKHIAKLRNKGNANGAKNIEVVDRHSWLHSNDTLNKKKNHSFRRSKSGDSETEVSKLRLSLSSTNIQQITAPVRTKSIPEIPKRDINIKEIDLDNKREQMCKSDPNILEIDKVKPKKKSKDRERRKSITKLLTTLFTKKSPGSNGSKGLFSKLSPKSKELSKEPVLKESARRNSFSEITVERNILTPPPIPPLPQNYSVKGTDESSDGEQDCKKDHSSCDTLDKLGTMEFSTSSNTGRRSSKALRAARQAQLKRHRMAQEIQRKLEETEVKTKELETRGVLVEKALRGEDNGENSNKDESELLQEWFDLMRDRTELRRYERELMVRAQELELEDRHARLQHELRDRLENNEPKTDKELKIEEDIINEMMTIVAERDSLISVIEEDRLRYSNEDRDLEEQMLAKGLRLTPIKKSPEK